MPDFRYVPPRRAGVKHAAQSDQPAMDHLLANSENPIPPADQQLKGSEADDFDEEDTDALAAHIKSKGGTVKDEDLQARVSLLPLVRLAS